MPSVGPVRGGNIWRRYPSLSLSTHPLTHSFLCINPPILFLPFFPPPPFPPSSTPLLTHPSVYLLIHHPLIQSHSIHLPFHSSSYLSIIHLLSMYLSICLSIHPFIHPPISLSRKPSLTPPGC
jgi:hypothetical protein